MQTTDTKILNHLNLPVPNSIYFQTKLLKINSWIIVHLPKEERLKLPSRATVAVEGTINNIPFKTVLEPDGKGSHWFRTSGKEGEVVIVEIEPTKDWLEPEVPED